MSWLTSLDVDWLKSNIAPKSSELPVWDHAGAYFRQLGVTGGDSAIYEVAYHAATPGKSFSITFTVEKDVESVFHGTSLAGACKIIQEASFKVSYGSESFVPAPPSSLSPKKPLLALGSEARKEIHFFCWSDFLGEGGMRDKWPAPIWRMAGQAAQQIGMRAGSCCILHSHMGDCLQLSWERGRDPFGQRPWRICCFGVSSQSREAHWQNSRKTQ